MAMSLAERSISLSVRKLGHHWWNPIPLDDSNDGYRIRRLRLSRLLLVQEARHPSPRIIRTFDQTQ
jgi:hypothetical protein